MAVSEGGTLTLGSKRSLIIVDDIVSLASQAATITSQGRDLTPATISESLMAQSVDELKLPPPLNLVSQDYIDWNASKCYNKQHMTQHMLHGALEQKDLCQLY